MRHYRLIFLLSSLLAGLLACQPLPNTPPIEPTIPPPTHLWIGVTDSAADLLLEVTAAYEREDVVLHIMPGNSRAIYDDLLDGQLDAAVLNTIPFGNDFWFNPIALDGLVIIVHPDNPVQTLTRPEIQAIFSGRITNWAELGGENQPIATHIREQGAGDRVLFRERVMEEQRVAISAVLQPNQTAVLEAIAADPYAIGYTMLSGLPEGNMAVSMVSALAIEGLDPEPNTVGTQQYPLTVPLYFLADGEPQGKMRQFLAWLQSVETQQRFGQTVGRVR